MTQSVRIAVAGAGLIGQAHIKRILEEPQAVLTLTGAGPCNQALPPVDCLERRPGCYGCHVGRKDSGSSRRHFPSISRLRSRQPEPPAPSHRGQVATFPYPRDMRGDAECSREGHYLAHQGIGDLPNPLHFCFREVAYTRRGPHPSSCRARPLRIRFGASLSRVTRCGDDSYTSGWGKAA